MDDAEILAVPVDGVDADVNKNNGFTTPVKKKTDPNSMDSDEHEFHTPPEEKQKSPANSEDAEPASKQAKSSSATSQNQGGSSGLAGMEKNGICVSCWDNKSTTVLLPCRHLCLCDTCVADLVVTATPCCPICRADISEIMKVFIA